MILWPLLALALSFATGLALVSWLWPGWNRRLDDLLLRLALAASAGLALSSGSAFVWFCVAPDSPALLPAIDLALLLLLLFLAWRSSKAQERLPAAQAASAHTPPPSRLLAGALALAALATGFFVLRSLITRQIRMPHGDWDAWMIWNLKARFFVRAGPGWVAILTDGWSWSHPDYPLLLPLTNARFWRYLGADPPLVPQALTILFTLLLLGVLYAGLARLRGYAQAALAVLFLATSTFFIKCGAMQCADIPLALYILASAVAFTLAMRDEAGSDKPVALAGLFLASAAWTKNEGILFAAAFVCVAVATSLLQRDRPAAARRLAPLFAGLFPLAMILLATKLVLAGGTDLFVAQKGRSAGDFVAMALSPARHELIWRYLIGLVRAIPDATLALMLLAYVAATGVAACIRRRGPASPLAVEPRDRFALGVTGLALLLLGAGDYAAYLFSPHELAFHLSTSLERVFMQLWPTLVFLLFLTLRTPAEVLAPGAARPDSP